jgi:putative holliday junction resolvase
MRILGLDIGDKRIGVAMCDPDEILASPLTTINRIDDEQAVGEIKAIVDKNKISIAVAGMPYSLSGQESQQTVKTREFALKLESAAGIKIEFQDERLTTNEARRLLNSSGSKKNRQKGDLDSAAAAILLQAYIDTHKKL